MATETINETGFNETRLNETNTPIIGTAGNAAPTPQPTVATKPDRIGAEVLGSEVIQRLLPKLFAISTAELVQINVDVPTAITTVLGAIPRIRTHRAGILALMPSFDMLLFDELEDYVVALDDAHGTYLTATKPSDELAAALEEATDLRNILVADATALVHRGVLDSNALAELKGIVGYKNIATDLNILVKALESVLAVAKGKSGISAEELNRAHKLHRHIYRLVGLREQSEPAASAAANLRQRTYTALLNCYDHVRRGVSALRWEEGDADEIAPSLHINNGGGRKKASPANVNSGTAGIQPGSGAATPGSATPGGATPGTAGATTNSAGPGSTGVNPAVGANPVTQASGKPGANPFIA